MSGIAGIIHFDGKPVEPGLIEKMTSAMKCQSPDERGIWISGNVGFGHAMLRTSPESKNEHQPCTLDSQVWITADARVDGRTELIEQLRSAGHRVSKDSPDVELVLHAYAAWGESFLDHLIGDFALALWDGRQKQLICAQDHFGVRPLFYIKTERLFVFASTIDALLMHPAVSRRLDETAVADFLLWGAYLDAELSIYRDIRRLPAAMLLIVDPAGRCTKSAFWELTEPAEIRHRSCSAYLEQFQDLFSRAVNDRIRTKHVAVEMSGGMDSTSIAAVAWENMKVHGGTVRAFTNVADSILPGDREGYFAGIVASHLGIPIEYHSVAEYALFERFKNPALVTAEPAASPNLAFSYDVFNAVVGSGARVLLNGFSGDALFEKRSTYCPGLFRRGHFAKFMTELYRYWRRTGTLRGLGLRTLLMRAARQSAPVPFPEWLDPTVVKDLRLEERWCEAWLIYRKYDTVDQLRRPWMGFGAMGYEVLRMPFEARFPFLDVRLVAFLVGAEDHVKYDKYLLRKVMCGTLPKIVRTRPKEGVPGDLIREKILRDMLGVPADWMNGLASSGYVDTSRYKQVLEDYKSGKGRETTFSSDFIILPVALSNWLNNRVLHNHPSN